MEINKDEVYQYYLYKKYLYSNLLYKMATYFLDTQYFTHTFCIFFIDDKSSCGGSEVFFLLQLKWLGDFSTAVVAGGSELITLIRLQ